MASSEEDTHAVYQRIGEFVVAFQWLEDTLRQIGWFILDPQRKQWPPKGLRTETSEALARKVDELFSKAIRTCGLADADDRAADFHGLVERFHAVRKVRNQILHSAYIELKAGEEIIELIRANPKLKVDPDTGDVIFDSEALSPNSFNKEMGEIGDLGFRFGGHLKQLHHKLPTT